MEDKTKSQSAKIQTILAKLDKVGSKQEEPKQNIKLQQEQLEPKQTVSDDFNVEASIEEKIIQQEGIIRDTLALFNINYDDLIKMDGKSAYCKAIQFYPYLKDEVKKADCPPLVALQIAKAMQPYLDFTSKYGQSLEEIKQSLKQEIENDKKQQYQPEKQDAKPINQVSVFADMEGAITSKDTKKAREDQSKDSLASLFDR